MPQRVMNLHSGGEASIVGGAEAGRRVPTSDGSETGDTGLGSIRGAVVNASANVVEAVAVLVDERVQETHSRLASIEADVVKLSEDTSNDRARSGSSRNTAILATLVGNAVGVGLATKGSNIRVGTTSAVEVLGVRQDASGSSLGEVLLHNGGLVRRNAEGVGKSTTTAVPGSLSTNGGLRHEVGTTDRSDVRRTGREIWVEDRVGRGVSGASPHTLVTRGKQDGQTHGTSKLELGVAGLHVLGGGLLHLVVTVGNRVDPRGVGHGHQVVNEIQQRVGAGVEDSERDRISDGSDVLNVQHGLSATGLGAERRVVATNSGSNGTSNTTSIVEVGQISLVPVLTLELRNGNRALGIGGVQAGETVSGFQDGRSGQGRAIGATRVELRISGGRLLLFQRHQQRATDSRETNDIVDQVDNVSKLLRQVVRLGDTVDSNVIAQNRAELGELGVEHSRGDLGGHNDLDLVTNLGDLDVLDTLRLQVVNNLLGVRLRRSILLSELLQLNSCEKNKVSAITLRNPQQRVFLTV